MPIERQRLMFFAYFHRTYKEFVLEASRNSRSSILRPESVLKVWEDGLLQFTASKNATEQETAPPMPTVVDACTGQEQQFHDLGALSASDLVTLFGQLVSSGKVWRMQIQEDDWINGWSNPCVELLTTRMKTKRWDGTDKIPGIGRLIEAGVDDSTVAIAMCFAHELWGTHLWKARMAVHVDTILVRGLTVETEKHVGEILQMVETYRPNRELIGAFADPAPFQLDHPNRAVLHFSTPLLLALPVGPVISGTPEHNRLVKFAPLIKMLSGLDEQYPTHTLGLENIEWCMEAYRLSVETMRCRRKDTSAVEHLLCNRPHLQVPMSWRRSYNKMGIECIDDLVIH